MDNLCSKEEPRFLELIVEMWGVFIDDGYENQNLNNCWFDQNVLDSKCTIRRSIPTFQLN